MKNKRLVITLDNAQMTALENLSKLECRTSWQQATLIIRRELELQGLIAPANAQPVITPPAQEPSAQGESDQIKSIQSEK